MPRADLNGAPYNPRRIGEQEKKKLRASLEKNGLVSTITWNRRTGNIVGGHQRLAAIDALEGTKNYLLDVAVIDVDEKEEKAINVALNNQAAMGTWDMEALGGLLSGDADIIAMGFSDQDVFNLIGDVHDGEKTAEKLLEIGEKIRQAKEKYTQIAKNNKAKNDCEFYDVIVWPDKATRIAFWAEMGHSDPDAKHKSGQEIVDLLIGTNETER